MNWNIWIPILFCIFLLALIETLRWTARVKKERYAARAEREFFGALRKKYPEHKQLVRQRAVRRTLSGECIADGELWSGVAGDLESGAICRCLKHHPIPIHTMTMAHELKLLDLIDALEGLNQKGADELRQAMVAGKISTHELPDRWAGVEPAVDPSGSEAELEIEADIAAMHDAGLNTDGSPKDPDR